MSHSQVGRNPSWVQCSLFATGCLLELPADFMQSWTLLVLAVVLCFLEVINGVEIGSKFHQAIWMSPTALTLGGYGRGVSSDAQMALF